MKKFILGFMALTSLMSAINTQAGIKVSDRGDCHLFTLDNDIERGQVGADIISNKISHGIVTQNIKIDFDQRNVSFHIATDVSLGFNRKLMEERVFISADNPGINQLVDMHRKDLYALQEICISDKNEIIDFKVESN